MVGWQQLRARADHVVRGEEEAGGWPGSTAALCGRGRGARRAAEGGTRARDSDGGRANVVERRGSGFWAGRAPHVVGSGIALRIVSVSSFKGEKHTSGTSG